MMRTELKQYNFDLPTKQELQHKLKRGDRLVTRGPILVFVGVMMALPGSLLVSTNIDDPHPSLPLVMMMLGVCVAIMGAASLFAGIAISNKGYDTQYQQYCEGVYQGKVTGKSFAEETDTWSVLMAGFTLQNELATTWMEVDKELWDSVKIDDYIEIDLPKGLKPKQD